MQIYTMSSIIIKVKIRKKFFNKNSCFLYRVLYHALEPFFLTYSELVWRSTKHLKEFLVTQLQDNVNSLSHSILVV